MFQIANFRKWFIGLIPDSLNFCTKYTGKYSMFRGANAPTWMIYKLLFHPQDKCLYRWEGGKKVEHCICCHDVWFNSITALVMLIIGGISVLTVAPALFWGWVGTVGLIILNAVLLLYGAACFLNAKRDNNHANKLETEGEQND